MSFDLEIHQGGTYNLPLIWQDSSKTPIDISGRQARMHVRATHSDDAILLELTTENGRIVLGGVDGTITLALTASETAVLTLTFGVYDLELYYDDSGTEVVDKIIWGNVTVIPEVTRA